MARWDVAQQTWRERKRDERGGCERKRDDASARNRPRRAATPGAAQPRRRAAARRALDAVGALHELALDVQVERHHSEGRAACERAFASAQRRVACAHAAREGGAAGGARAVDGGQRQAPRGGGSHGGRRRRALRRGAARAGAQEEARREGGEGGEQRRGRAPLSFTQAQLRVSATPLAQQQRNLVRAAPRYVTAADHAKKFRQNLKKYCFSSFFDVSSHGDTGACGQRAHAAGRRAACRAAGRGVCAARRVRRLTPRRS